MVEFVPVAKRKLEQVGFSIAEAALFLGVSPNSVRALLRAERLHAFEVGAGTSSVLRIRRDVLENFTMPVVNVSGPSAAVAPDPLRSSGKVRESHDAAPTFLERMEKIKKDALDAKRQKKKS